MATPVVQDADTTTGTQSSSNATWTFTYPSNISAGDLIVIFAAVNPNTVMTPPSGFTSTGSIFMNQAALKRGTGTETGTDTMNFSSPATGHWVVYRITGWDKVINGGWVFSNSNGTSTTPDPPSQATTGQWDAGDPGLAIAYGATISNETFSGFPSGYTDTYSVNDANGGSLALARKAVTASPENPGSFTIGSSVVWGATTFVIHGDNGGPKIQIDDSRNGTQTTNSTSWTLTYPANIAAGDLILFLVAADGAGANAGSISGFTDVNSVGATASAQCLAKIATGSESGTVTFTSNGSEQGSWYGIRITDWFGSGLPSGDNQHDGTGLDSAQQTETTSTTPDPPNLDPALWGTEITLWIALAGNDGTPTTTAFPFTAYQNSRSSGGAGGANVMWCASVQSVGSLNPGTFTISASEQWSAVTVAVRPAAAAVTLPPTRSPWPVLQAVNRVAVY